MKKRTILEFIVAIVAIPLMLDKMVFANKIISHISNDAWASFFGSYIGGVCTLITVFITISYNNRQIREQQAIQQATQKEEARLHIRPYLCTSTFDFKRDVIIGDCDRIIEFEAEHPQKGYRGLAENLRTVIEHSSSTNLLHIAYRIGNIGAGSAVDMVLYVNGFQIKTYVAKDKIAHLYFIVWTLQEDKINIEIEMTYTDVESRGHYLKKDVLYFEKESNGTYKSHMDNGEIQLLDN